MTLLQGEGYEVDYDAAAGVVRISGVLRLGGMTEYQPISQLLEQALDEMPEPVLDMVGLEFLNSSGIATLSQFVIAARKRAGCSLTIKASNTVPWQGKSLNNLKRLMPSLTLSFA